MCCPTSSLTLSVNSVYCIWLEFWAPQVCFTFLSLNDTVISRDTLAPYHFVCYFRGNFYIYTLIDFVVCVLRVMCYFKQSSPTVNNLMWMSLIISHRFLWVGWLSPGVNIYVIWPDIPTPIWRWTILHSYQCVGYVWFPQLCSGGHCWTLEIWGSFFKISSLIAIFPF